MENYMKNAGRPGDHLDQTPCLNPHRKNPFSVGTLFGEKTNVFKKTVLGTEERSVLFRSLRPSLSKVFFQYVVLLFGLHCWWSFG